MAPNDRHEPPTIAAIYGADPTLPARCGCGRHAALDKLHDVRGFPAGIYPAGEPFVCDACFSLPLYQGRVTHAAMVHFTGGTPAAVARARVKHAAEVKAGNHRPLPTCLDAP